MTLYGQICSSSLRSRGLEIRAFTPPHKAQQHGWAIGPGGFGRIQSRGGELRQRCHNNYSIAALRGDRIKALRYCPGKFEIKAGVWGLQIFL